MAKTSTPLPEQASPAPAEPVETADWTDNLDDFEKAWELDARKGNR